MIEITGINSFGQALRNIRKSQDLTQEQLAAACGVGRRSVVDLEGGKSTCHLGKALQVLEALGVEIRLAGRGGEF